MSRAFLLLLCLAACKKSQPQKTRFCDQDLSGIWLNASDKHFAYRFRDHGDVVRGEFVERADDGTLKNPDEPILFELHRTETALAGVMRSTQPTKGGRNCPVEFGMDVTCGANLQAIVETDVDVGEDCKRLGPTHRTEFVFVRDTTHPSGGGETPDAH